MHAAKKYLIAAVLMPLAALTPPLAHADTDSYLKYLRDNNIVTGFLPSTSSDIRNGMRACDLLRAGLSVDQIVADSQWKAYGVDVRGIATGAQQHLCPETIT